MGSTSELSETMAATFNIDDEIVGLKVTAFLRDEDAPTFQQHGDIVIPLSTVVSGQLKQIIMNAESIPSFSLVVKTAGSLFDRYRAAEASYISPHYKPTIHYEKRDEISSEGEETSASSSSTGQETVLYTEAFINLMESSNDFAPDAKNALLRFGIDNAEHGNALFRASFRVAVFMENTEFFVQCLKSIAAVLLDGKSSTKSIFDLIDFVVAADELYETSDLTAEQYVTLLNAIFEGDSDIERLFDLHRSPEFQEACGSNDMASSLLLRDLLHLGKILTPISQSHDNLLKWAIRTGIHNLSSRIHMPQEFVNIIYHMFSSGDELVLSACEQFLETNDSDVVESMILREWDIFCKNKDCRLSNEVVEGNSGVIHKFSSENETGVFKSLSSSAFDTSLNEFSITEDCGVPDLLITAVTALVDLQEISDDAAAAILASYQKGNQLLHDVYKHFVDFGNTDEFLSMVSLKVSQSAAFILNRVFIMTCDVSLLAEADSLSWRPV